VRLDSICTVKTGPFGAQLHQSDYVDAGTPIVTVEHLGVRGLAHENLPLVSDNDKQRLSQYILKEGDIVFSRVGSVDRNSLVTSGEDGWLFSGRLLRVRKRHKEIDSRFLSFYFNQTGFKNYMYRIAVGGVMPSLNTSLLSGVSVSLPPLPEQRKISVILSAWDKAIELVGKQFTAKQCLKKGLMQQLLTGKIRFPGFIEEWREMQLGQFLKMKLRKVEKPKDAYLRLGVRSHGRGTFTTVVEDPSSVDMTHLYQIREGDLIVSITFAWEGAIAMVEVDGDGAHVSHRFPTFLFDTKKVVPEFFRYLMHMPRYFYDLRVVSPGGAGRNRVMSKRNFLKIKVIVPTIEEQRKIGGLLTSLDLDIDKLSKLLEQLEKIKQGLMQKLLTGEVRVTE
jgi:type I restriction enzyme S subunit